MKVTIDGQYPDGLNINIEGIIVDTVSEANNLINLLYKVVNNLENINDKRIGELIK